MSDENISSIEMYEWGCANCGVVMWMPKALNGQLKLSHNTFYCISGHANVYSKKTEIEEVEGKLANEYVKNAQLEGEIKKLKKSLINRIFKP
jgi:hypothetical protein